MIHTRVQCKKLEQRRLALSVLGAKWRVWMDGWIEILPVDSRCLEDFLKAVDVDSVSDVEACVIFDTVLLSSLYRLFDVSIGE